MQQGEASVAGAGCGEAQQCRETCMLSTPSPKLGLLLNGVVQGAGRCAQVMHRGRATMLGHNDITVPKVCSELRMAIGTNPRAK